MKKLSFLLLIVIAFSAILASCTPKSAVSNKSIFLRLHPRKGSAYSISTNTTKDMTIHAVGLNIKAKARIDERKTVNLKVVKKYKKDSLLIRASIQHLAIKTSVNSPRRHKKMSFDSDSSQKANNGKLSDYFNKIKNSHFIIKLTPFGKILDVKGLKNLRKAGKKSPQIVNPATKKALNHLLSNKNFKKLFSSGIYRKKPVRKGSQWSNEKTISGKIPMTIHLTYTVKDIQPDKILLDVKGQINSTKDSITVRGMTIPAHYSGTSTGNYTISRSSGLVVSGTVDSDINATWSIIGQTMDMKIKRKTNITTTKLEK